MMIGEFCTAPTTTPVPEERRLLGRCEEYKHEFNAYMPCNRRIVVLDQKTEAYMASTHTLIDGTFQIKGLPVTGQGEIEVHAHDDVTGLQTKIFNNISLVE